MIDDLAVIKRIQPDILTQALAQYAGEHTLHYARPTRQHWLIREQ